MDGELRILVLTTGGTIGSAKSEEGVKPQKEVIEGVIAEARKNINASNVGITVTELFAIDSTNMDPEHEKEIFDAVVKGIREGYNAIIITHGTDTLAFTSSLLALRLNPKIPIVITGSSKIPSDPSTDAVINMETALLFAINSAQDLGGVFVAFNKKIIEGKFAYEVHPGKMSAFESPTGPFAEFGWNEIVPLVNDKVKEDTSEVLIRYQPAEKEPNIAIIGLTPWITPESLKMQAQGAEGILLVGYGSLGVPESLRDTLKNIAEHVPVVLTAYVPTDMKDGFYEVSKAAEKIGVTIGTGILPLDSNMLLVELERNGVSTKLVSEAFVKLREEMADSTKNKIDTSVALIDLAQNIHRVKLKV
ncbi:MAG: asparaginase [Candidatus Micrarchaeia archaeon]